MYEADGALHLESVEELDEYVDLCECKIVWIKTNYLPKIEIAFDLTIACFGHKFLDRYGMQPGDITIENKVLRNIIPDLTLRITFCNVAYFFIDNMKSGNALYVANHDISDEFIARDDTSMISTGIGFKRDSEFLDKLGAHRDKFTHVVIDADFICDIHIVCHKLDVTLPPVTKSR